MSIQAKLSPGSSQTNMLQLEVGHGICENETVAAECDYSLTMAAGTFTKISLGGTEYAFNANIDATTENGRELLKEKILWAINEAGYNAQDGIRLTESGGNITITAEASALVFDYLEVVGNPFVQTCP
jgi:hypothetical protein